MGLSALGAFSGGMVGGSVVKLLLDDKQYMAELERAKGATAAGTTTMSSGWAKFGAAAKAGFAVAGIAAAVFLKDSVQAFLNHEQVLAQFEVAMKDAGLASGGLTDELRRQAEELESLTGYTQDEIIAADTILARFKLTGYQLKQALPVVLDFARATGREIPDAAKAVGKALLGNTRALKDVGVKYTTTGDQAQDFGNILDLLKERVGGAAEAFGETNAGKIAKFNAALHEVAIATGEALMPVLQRLLTVLKVLLPVIAFLGEHVGQLLTIFLGYKVLMFLPQLLMSIGIAAEAMNFEMVAAGAERASYALSALGKTPILIAITAIVGVITALGNASAAAKQRVTDLFNALEQGESVDALRAKAQLLADHLEEVSGGFIKSKDVMAEWEASLVKAQEAVELQAQADEAAKRAVEAHSVAVQQQARVSKELADQERDTAGATRAGVDSAKSLAAARRQAAQATEDLLNKEMELAGGFTAVIGAGREVQDAQAELNKLRRAGKTDTQAYRDAEANALDALTSFIGATSKYQATAGGAHKATDLLRGTINVLATSLGISKSQASSLVGQFDSLIGRADTLKSKLAALDGTTVNFSIVAHYSSTGTPGRTGGVQY